MIFPNQINKRPLASFSTEVLFYIFFFYFTSSPFSPYKGQILKKKKQKKAISNYEFSELYRHQYNNMVHATVTLENLNNKVKEAPIRSFIHWLRVPLCPTINEMGVAA